MIPSEHLERAIEFVGSQSALAAQIGFSQQSISDWLRGLKPVSAEAAIRIEVLSDGKITAKQLRPDLYKKPQP